MSGRVIPAVAGLAVGTVLGLMIGRAPSLLGTLRARRVLNGNYGWMTPMERRLVHTLMRSGHSHVLQAWPPPGAKDAEKRRLLGAAAAHMDAAPQALEEARLSVLQPPIAPKRPKQLEAHNDLRTDDYYWLRDDARKDPQVLSHLAAENAYMSAVLADTTGLQEALYQEMRGRIQEEDQSVPYRHKGYMYYSRTEEGQQYRIHCRRPVAPGGPPPSENDAVDPSQPEEVLLDENLRKEQGKHSFYMVGSVDVSPNQQLLAWTEDTVGGEKYTLHVKDLASGKEVTTPVPNTSGDATWANDNATLFYVVKDELDRPYKVLRHRIGSPPGSDVVVYEESDESFYVGVGRSASERVLYLHSGSAVTSETRWLDADTPDADWTVVLPRVPDVEYSVSHHPGAIGAGGAANGAGAGGWWLITVRDAEHPNSELRAAPLADPGAQRVLLPHRADVKLEGASLAQRWLVVSERANAQQRLVVYALPGEGAEMPSSEDLAQGGQEVRFEEAVYALSGDVTGDWDSNVLRLHYTSLTTPSSVYDQGMSDVSSGGKRILKKVQPVLGGFSSADYESARLWAVAPDGVKVPVSLVWRKGLAKLDGSDPMFLNGYGSYESRYDPTFSSTALSLIDRGFVFGIAHIRGGGDMGRMWYEDGKYLKKKNTFTDFIAVAEHLIKEKYTSPERLCIQGRSAGGLLMGAVLNMRPDLFGAAVAGVPFVDVLTTISDETIPLTVIEWEEWGNPKEPEFYEYIKSYSPVDNVKAQRYPHILCTGGLHDPRVGYWEPAKFVARLRELKTDSNLLLLKMELGAGHFSVTGRFERLKEVALEYAFVIKAMGMMDVPPLPGSAAAALQPSGADGAVAGAPGGPLTGQCAVAP